MMNAFFRSEFLYAPRKFTLSLWLHKVGLFISQGSMFLEFLYQWSFVRLNAQTARLFGCLAKILGCPGLREAANVEI